jgi:dienelactone hydrolase
MRIPILATLLALTAAQQARADFPDTETLRKGATATSDLVFPAELSTFGLFSTPQMALYKPEGAGPFPALILHHQCGGLRNDRWQNRSMLDWAKEAVARGYVALLVDTLGPRGAKTVCYGPQNNVTFATGVKDTLQAAEHLRKFDFVDKRRIAQAGYSWGAMVGVLASSKLWGEALSPGARPAAVVAFYPGCFTLRPKTTPPYEIVRPDIDRPLLVLMGADDNETPPADCISRLEPLKAQGAPVEWHVYPATTHCWDCANLHNFSKTDVRGNRVTYRYDQEVTADSARRLFEFLDKAMPARK